MKFPGRRSKKHYFPINDKNRDQFSEPLRGDDRVYIVGLDQLLVDIEINVEDEFLHKYNFPKGQSFLISDEVADEIYKKAKENGAVQGEFPGGAVGNTLHNFAILSDSNCYALGVIKKNIEVGDYAFKYLSKTSGLVDMSYLQSADRPMGRALCFITPDRERTFGISKGCMNELDALSIPEDVIKNSAALLISAYTLRCESDAVYHATLKACEYAKKYKVPVVLSLGTSSLIEEKRDFFRTFAQDYVTVIAMNMDEAYAFEKNPDPLLTCESMLDLVDLILLTVGDKGLYVAGHCDEANRRKTNDPLVTKTIVNYNEFEYSRPMRKSDCKSPMKIYTHVNPFQGGPEVIKNTNGAGDAALSALLHDIAANKYHKDIIPNSPKHDGEYLSYSSISQISKYANRVSFEVLVQSSPRLYRGLPQKEDSLEEAHWRV